MKHRQPFRVIKETAQDLKADHGMGLAAGLAYYATLSLAPFLLVLLSLLGWIVQREAIGAELVNQMRSLVGDAGAEIASSVIQQSAKSEHRGLASILSFALLLVGASGLFVELQNAVNTIWEVKPRPKQNLWGFLRTRVVSFGMVLGIGFLMLVSLGFSAVLSGLNAYLENRFSGSSLLHKLLNEVLSFVIFASLFAAIFKYLPDAIISWRDVWIGAVATAVLFMAGKLAIGIYLGHSSVASMYGAAGSIVAWLVWVYYSSLLLLVGAEFTQVHARRSGMGIRPSKHAIRAKSHSK